MKRLLILLAVLIVLCVWAGLAMLSKNTTYTSADPNFQVTYPEGWVEDTRDRDDGAVVRLFGISSDLGKRGFYVNRLKEPLGIDSSLLIDPVFEGLHPVVAARFTDLKSNDAQIREIRTGPSTFAGQDVIEFVYEFVSEGETVGFVRIFSPLHMSDFEWLQFGQISLTSAADLDSAAYQAIEDNWQW
jgi:hypothetical protein